MINPTIEELTEHGKLNRYELAVAIAKCARIITSEYTKQREAAEKAINKESDRTVYSMCNEALCDEKSVKLAINEVYEGRFKILKAAEVQKREMLKAEEENAKVLADADSETETTAGSETVTE